MSAAAPLLLAGLLGAGAALAVFDLLARSPRRRTARRVATFLGTEGLGPPPAAGSVERQWMLDGDGRWLPRPPSVRSLLFGLLAVGLLLGLLLGSALGFALAGLAGMVLVVLSSRQQARERLELQAPEAVNLLAAGLRAGLSVPQAIELVARESPEPTAAEFARTTRELDLGLDLHETLERLARRTIADYELVAIVVTVQHEVGGNLVQALETVVDTLRERSELRQEVYALTAQQRLSAVILVMLPIGLFIYTLLANRSYLDPLLESLLGRLLLLMAAGLLALGWVAMRSAGRVEGATGDLA